MNRKNATKTNNLKFLLILLTLPLLLLSSFRSADAAGLRLIYANDNLGELDGCG
jgi:hypothetical protein